MHEYCLEFRIEKCSFAKSSMKYLGYCITADGISPSSHIIDEIREYQMPKNIHELTRFL